MENKRITKRILYFTIGGLAVNLIYGIGNGVLGIMTDSWWLITLSAYYLIISVMRFSVILFEKKAEKQSRENDLFIMKFSGYMFFVLDIVLIATTYLTIEQGIGNKYHEIIMISIAVYTFAKVTFAVVNLCKSKKINSPVLTTIRNISLADAMASIFSLQRSMLVSFGSLSASDIRLFNTLTGTGVCITVIVAGISMLRKER